MQRVVAAARLPAQCLNIDPDVLMEVDRVRNVPAIHAESLLAVVEPIGSEDLGHAEIGRAELGVALARNIEIVGTSEVVLGAGPGNRRKVAVPVKIELDFTLSPPSR